MPSSKTEQKLTIILNIAIKSYKRTEILNTPGIGFLCFWQIKKNCALNVLKFVKSNDKIKQYLLNIRPDHVLNVHHNAIWLTLYKKPTN